MFVLLGDRVREMLGEGRTVREVADALGLATNTVVYHRDRVPPPHRSIPDRRDTVARVGTHEAVKALLDLGLSQAEIARQLDLTKSTVSYHARRLGKPRDERGARRYDWSAVRAFYEAGHSVRECQLAFGFSSQTWHAAVNRGDVTARSHRIPDEELFAADTPRSRYHLKARIIEGNLLEAECATCGITDWRSRPISLALHHVNGDRHDNRLENLRFLCPNCHSQTDNFAGRNRRVLAA